MQTDGDPSFVAETAVAKRMWLERAMEAARLGVWDWNLDTDEVTFSDAYYGIAGYHPGDFPHRFESWRERVHPDDLEQALAAIADYISGRAAEYRAEFRFLRKDGDWIWIHARGGIVEWTDDLQPRRFIGIHTDVTDRKVTEHRLAEERRFTHAIMDSIPGLLFLYHADGRLVRWNRKHEELTGYSPEELSRMHLLDWYDDPAEAERIKSGVLKSLQTGYAEEDGHLRNKDGSHALYHFTAVRLELDGQTYFAGIGLNVEAQRNAEKQRLASETQYRSLFENMLHGFSLHEVITDGENRVVDSRLIDMNTAFCQLTGLQRDAAIGRTMRELVPGIETRWLEPYGRIALEGGTLHDTDYSAALDKYVETVAFSPAPRQYAVLTSDISEKVRQQQALEKANRQLAEANAQLGEANRQQEEANRQLGEANRQLADANQMLEERVQARTRDIEQANRELVRQMEELAHTQSELVRSERLASLGELMAGVAHEINTPIGVSVTAASFLDTIIEEYAVLHNAPEQPPDSSRLLSKIRESLRIILANLERASRLIRSFKQVSVDRTFDQVRRINLCEYLDEVVTSLEPSFRKTPHHLENLCAEDVWLTTHPGALSQIITNLLMNALQHAFPEGRPGTMTLSVGQTDHEVMLRFSDDGQGMDQETLQHAFDPFFTTRREAGGSGLGLFIVHNLIRNELNGSIACESSPGTGTRFLIRLPKDATDAGSA